MTKQKMDGVGVAQVKMFTVPEKKERVSRVGNGIKRITKWLPDSDEEWLINRSKIMKEETCIKTYPGNGKNRGKIALFYVSFIPKLLVRAQDI
jgi:hypothetical protein